MSGLLMIFMIFLFLMVFLPAMMYLLPVFLIIWLVSALVNSFRPRRQTGMGGNGRTFYYYRSSNPGQSGAMNRNPEIEKRAARPDSIDAEYTEVEVRDDTRDPQ